MKIELESSEIEAITRRTVEILRPLLSSNRNGKTEEDVIFDVPGLAAYLKMSREWVYERTHPKTTPFLKLGNKQVHFEKANIEADINIVGNKGKCL